MRDIGKNIKDLRSRRQMTQDELADKLFVTRQTVSNYENGKSRPDVDMLISIADILEVDIHEILYGPVTVPDRKQEYIRFGINAGLCLILWIMMYVLEDITRELYLNSFHIFPRMLQYYGLCPAAFFCTGYTLMQLLSLFTGLRPLKGSYAVWVRRGIIAVLVAMLLIMLPFFYSLIEGSIQYWIFSAQGAEGTFLYESPFKSTQLHYYLVRLLSDCPWFLGGFGMALWLVQKRRDK